MESAKEISQLPVRSGQPRVARLESGGDIDFVVIGTSYGFIHNANGSAKTWPTAAAARAALKLYRARELTETLDRIANGADEVSYEGRTYVRRGPETSITSAGKWRAARKK